LRRAHLNAHRRRRPGLLAESGSLEQYRPAFGARSAPSAEDAVTEQILDEKLEAAVQRLDPRFRLVLLLVDVDQLTYTEAAPGAGHPDRDRDVAAEPGSRADPRGFTRGRHITGEDTISVLLKTMLTCHWPARRIHRYLDADPAAPLRLAEIQRLERHLAVCARCAGVIADYRGLQRVFATWSRRQLPDAAVVARVRIACERAIAEDVR